MKRFPEELAGNNFDLMRLVLSVAVIFSHSFALLTGDPHSEPLNRVTHHFLSFGSVAVSGFFLVSGFLICHSWKRSKTAVQYAKRRAARIVPGFVVASILTVVVFATLGSDTPLVYLSSINYGRFLSRTAFLEYFSSPFMFPANPYPGHANGSLWTIPVEVRCYAVLALVGMVGLLRPRACLLIAAGFLLGNAYLAHHQVDFGGGAVAEFLTGVKSQDWISFGACFFCGAAFYLWRTSIPRHLMLAVFSMAILFFSVQFERARSVVLPVTFAYLAFYIAFSPVRPLHWLTSRGDVSYGVYLYAFPVQQLLVRFLGHALTPLTLFLLATPLTAILAIGSWVWIERPMLPAERRRRMSKEAETPVEAMAVA